MYALRKKIGSAAAVMLFAWLMTNPAHAGTGISLVAGGNMSGPAVSEVNASFDGATGYQAGLGFHFGDMIGFEFGAVYAFRQFEQTGTVLGIATTQTYSHYALQVPLMITVSPASFITIGAGGFAEWGSGKVKVKTQIGSAAAITTDTTFSGAGLRSYNRGAMGMLRLNLINMASSTLFVDGRYLYGITDVVQQMGFKIQHRDIQAMIGYRINLSK